MEDVMKKLLLTLAIVLFVLSNNLHANNIIVGDKKIQVPSVWHMIQIDSLLLFETSTGDVLVKVNLSQAQIFLTNLDFLSTGSGLTSRNLLAKTTRDTFVLAEKTTKNNYDADDPFYYKVDTLYKYLVVDHSGGGVAKAFVKEKIVPQKKAGKKFNYYFLIISLVNIIGLLLVFIYKLVAKKSTYEVTPHIIIIFLLTQILLFFQSLDLAKLLIGSDGLMILIIVLSDVTFLISNSKKTN